MSLQQLLVDYLQYLAKECDHAQKTINGTKYTLTPFVEEITLKSTQHDVSLYLQRRAQHKKTSSLNTEKSMIRAFLSYCRDYRRIELDMHPKFIKNSKEDDPNTTYYSVEEIQRIISLVKTAQDKLIIAFMYETGVRIGELVKIKVEDITGDQIRICGKGGKRRLVFITKEMQSLLEDHILRKGILSGCLFPQEVPKKSAPGNAYSISGIRLRFQRQLAPHGIHFKPHTMRHSFATGLLLGGCDLYGVMKQLGHKHIDTTQRYLHLNDPELKRKHSYLPQLSYASMLTN